MTGLTSKNFEIIIAFAREKSGIAKKVLARNEKRERPVHRTSIISASGDLDVRCECPCREVQGSPIVPLTVSASVGYERVRQWTEGNNHERARDIESADQSHLHTLAATSA